MTIYEANCLFESKVVSLAQWVNCLEDLCKEYGYIQGMTVANFRDSVSSQKNLAEFQQLIQEVKQQILKCTN